MVTRIICKKWDLFKSYKKPITSYLGKYYYEFDAPSYDFCHIIWKFVWVDNKKDIMEENNVKSIINLLPEDASH